MISLPRRAPLVVPAGLGVAGACVGAAAFGAVVGARPFAALALMGIAAVVALAFLAPVAHLTLLLFTTAIVPYDLQNAIGLAGSSTGLIASDVLLLSGLVRAALVLPRLPLRPRHLLASTAAVSVIALILLQSLRGLQLGVPVSLAGYELRSLLGWGTLLIAVPILLDQSGLRRLLTGLLFVGLALGLWGLAQYFLEIPIIGGGSAGVRENVAFTEGARSIQGGLFAFPIAFVMGLAALSSRERLSPRLRIALLGLVCANGASLLLTYERTFWVAAVVGVLFIVMRAGRGQKLKALMVMVVAVIMVLPLLAVFSPGSVASAQQRFLSLDQYGNDNSVRTRVVETRAVASRIREAPFAGWGLGAQVSYGYPWLSTPAQSTPYTHNGYLWLAWKLGIPGALLLLLLLGWAVAARRPPDLTPLLARVRHGAQAGLLVTLTVSLMFPAFRALAITTTLGVLVALSLIHPRAPSDAHRMRTTPAGR